MAYERAQKAALTQRLGETPQRLIIVTGPRQTGKTTLVQQVLGQGIKPYRYLAVDKPDSDELPAGLAGEWGQSLSHEPSGTLWTEGRDAHWLVYHWEDARRECAGSERGFVLVIDEIQKIPDWSESVKGLWDADRLDGLPLHVILLGSAPLSMQQGMSESLAGRYEAIHLTHWSYAEMSAAFGFDLQRYLYFGGYPGAAALVHDQDRWGAYIRDALIEPNIERDILALQRVDKPALLKCLLSLGIEYSGQILSYNKMLGQLQDAGNTTTLARYLDLLSHAGLMTGIPKYASGAARRRASSPKLNVLNTALMTALSGYSFEQACADRGFWGRLVESAAGAHLLHTGMPNTRLYYWRHNAFEVDFVLERARQLVALEIKSGRRRLNASGLKAFRSRFKTADAFLVGQGGISLQEFFETPASQWLQGA